MKNAYRNCNWLIVLFIGALLASACTKTQAPTAPTITPTSMAAVQPTHHPFEGSRVLVAGLEGVDWDFLLSLIEKGKAPHIESILKQGRGFILESEEPLLAPSIWTTIATGYPRKVHGILDSEVSADIHDVTVVSSANRRIPAIWNVLSSFGRNVDVIGWWGTWPVEYIYGSIVSDQYIYDFPVGDSDITGNLIHPGSLQDELASYLLTASDIADASVELFIGEKRMALIREQENYQKQFSVIKRALASAESCRRIAENLWRNSQPEMAMIYLEGTGRIREQLTPPEKANRRTPRRLSVHH